MGEILTRVMESCMTGQPPAEQGNPRVSLTLNIKILESAVSKTNKRRKRRSTKSNKRRKSSETWEEDSIQPEDTPIVARSKKDVMNLDANEIEHQLDVIQTADRYVEYTLYNYIKVRTKNLQLRLQHGTRYVTVEGFVRLLVAQPWRSLITKALPFRIIRAYDHSLCPKLRLFITTVQNSIVEHAMARWEMQFWLDLPSKPEEFYTDPIDAQFIEAHINDRSLRKARLFSTMKKLSSQLDHLIALNIVPAAARHDLGFIQASNQVSWMPTRINLLHDMAIRAARDPCRFYFVFNKFAHSFYELKYHLAFPPLQNTPPSLTLPDPLCMDTFGEYLLAKYWPDQTFDDLLLDATAEWHLYQEQLQNRTKEPPLTQPFPDQDDFKLQNSAVFENCRYAYFDKKNCTITETPCHPDDSTIVFDIDDSTPADNIWQAQPVPNVCIEEYVLSSLTSLVPFTPFIPFTPSLTPLSPSLTPFTEPILTSIMPMTPLIEAVDFLTNADTTGGIYA